MFCALQINMLFKETNKMADEKWYHNALMVNRDPCWYWHAIDDSSAEACRKSVENYFSLYEGAITDICLCVFEQSSLIPSDAFHWRGEKYFWKKENGIDVDYTNTPIKNLYKCFAEYKVDAVQIFIDCMKKLGIRPWISLRMNDAHFNADATSFLHSEMFYEEVAAGHVIGEKYGYYGKCFDFKYPRYKNALLKYIEEVVGKYDMFGFEIDFMRECHCFDYKNDPECHKIMTEYIREIRKIVRKAEERVGHDIKVSLRTCRSPRDAKAFGFDVKTLVDEGLIDVVIPAPRWSPTDSGIPIREWRELLGDDFPIVAGIEASLLKLTTNQPENSKAYAASFYAQGADGIYFHNHEYYNDHNRAAWRITRENCLEGHREFVVLFQDMAAYDEWRYKPLPLAVDGSADLPLELGKIKPEDKVKVVIDFAGEEAPTLDAGSVTAVVPTDADHITVGSGEKAIDFTPNKALEFDISGVSTEGPLTLTFNGKGTVNYVTIRIDAK